MWSKSYWLGAILGIALLATSAAAQEAVRWARNLEEARHIAGQSGRLVMIEFWAPWCGACRKMDQEVFSRPDVGGVLEANYIPVKLDIDQFPAIARQYGVTALPAIVITSGDGRQIERLQGALPASRFLGALDQIARNARPRPSQLAGGPPAASNQPTPPRASHEPRYATNHSEPAPRTPDLRTPTNTDLGPRYGQQAPIGQDYRQPPTNPVSPPIAQRPPAMQPPASPAMQPPASPAPAAENLPLGLEGYCPVHLVEQRQWVVGDRRWGARHEGRLYLFSGPEEQRRFLADPHHYGPVMSGNDVVLVLEQGQTVPGRREHGVFFSNRIYLFSNEASLEKFSKRPNYYANAVLHTRQAVQYNKMYR